MNSISTCLLGEEVLKLYYWDFSKSRGFFGIGDPRLHNFRVGSFVEQPMKEPHAGDFRGKIWDPNSKNPKKIPKIKKTIKSEFGLVLIFLVLLEFFR